LHEVASKALQEDIADFLAADPVAETLKMNVENPGLLKSVEVAPTAAITGSLTMKLEILLNYLQVFWLIYNWDVRWPTLWVEIYSNFDFTRIVLTAIPSLAFSGSAGAARRPSTASSSFRPCAGSSSSGTRRTAPASRR